MLLSIWRDNVELNGIEEKLYHLQRPVQSKNAGPLVQKLFIISGWKIAEH